MTSKPTPEELLKKLDDLHQAYLRTFAQVHEALSNQATENASSPLAGATKRRRRSTLDPDAERPLLTAATLARKEVFATNESNFSDELSETEDELFVQEPLPSYSFDTEHLRDHLKRYRFNEEGNKILDTVITQNGRLLNPSALFPLYAPTELFHNSHYTVFDVGKDGAPVSRRKVVEEGSTIDSAIWQAIRVGNFPDFLGACE
jgi:hypothetical protein